MDFSNDCIKESLDLFGDPYVQKEIVDSRFVEYIPQHMITRDGLITFNIMGSGDEYIDMRSSFLKMSVKISQKGGVDIDPVNKYFPVNNFMHSIIKKVDVTYNNTLVATDYMNYHYRAYIQSILNFNKSQQQSLLTASCFSKDEAGKFNSLTKDKTANNGALERLKRVMSVDNRGYIHMTGRLFVDLFTQKQFIPNDVDVGINLTLQDVEYPFMSDKAPLEYDITQLSFFAKKISLNENYLSQIEQNWVNNPIIYPFIRSSVKTFPIVQSHLHFHRDNLFTGYLPSRIFIGFVESEAFMKTKIGKNPYEFKPFGVNHLTLYKNDKMIPAIPYTPNFETQDCLRSFQSIFNATNTYYEEGSLNINFNEYINGYTLWGFDLTPDGCGEDYFTDGETGNIKLEIRFKEALEVNVTVIVYADFHSKLLINNSREVIPQYIL